MRDQQQATLPALHCIWSGLRCSGKFADEFAKNLQKVASRIVDGRSRSIAAFGRPDAVDPAAHEIRPYACLTKQVIKIGGCRIVIALESRIDHRGQCIKQLFSHANVLGPVDDCYACLLSRPRD